MNVDAVILGDWSLEPRAMAACLKIWRALSARSYQLDHYTFEELSQLAKSNDEKLISRVLLYLATPKLSVLRMCLMYEFEGHIFELPEAELVHYSKGEKVIHPEFGEPIPESEILLCFTPGPRLLPEGKA